MSNTDRNAARLNRLPQSHWNQWYAQERAMNRLLDIAVAEGKGVIAAADFATEGVLRKSHLLVHPAFRGFSVDALATVIVNAVLKDASE